MLCGPDVNAAQLDHVHQQQAKPCNWRCTDGRHWHGRSSTYVHKQHAVSRVRQLYGVCVYRQPARELQRTIQHGSRQAAGEQTSIGPGRRTDGRRHATRRDCSSLVKDVVVAPCAERRYPFPAVGRASAWCVRPRCGAAVR